MQESKEKIEFLKKFFTISTAGFNFMKTTLETMGQPIPEKVAEMQKLHQWALDFLNGINLLSEEDMNKSLVQIDNILSQMERLASTPFVPKNIEKGGVHFKNN